MLGQLVCLFVICLQRGSYSTAVLKKLLTVVCTFYQIMAPNKSDERRNLCRMAVLLQPRCRTQVEACQFRGWWRARFCPSQVLPSVQNVQSHYASQAHTRATLIGCCWLMDAILPQPCDSFSFINPKLFLIRCFASTVAFLVFV